MTETLALPDQLCTLVTWLMRQPEARLPEVAAYTRQDEASAHAGRTKGGDNYLLPIPACIKLDLQGVLLDRNRLTRLDNGIILCRKLFFGFLCFSSAGW